jgi:hypothetical protein
MADPVRRAHVLLELQEYDHLEHLARRTGSSVSALIRDAVRDRYFPVEPDRQAIVAELLAIRFPMTEEWRALGKLIDDARDAELR